MMDYRNQLLVPLSKRFADKLAAEIYACPADFIILYNLIFDSDVKVAWRAAWACQKISEKQPKWFTDTNFDELAVLAMATKHGGMKRGCLSILNNLPLPEVLSVEFVNSCFEWMVSPQCPIAVQALSMKMLYKICCKEPDFTPEFKAYLENANPDDYSPGFISTRKNVLKLLKTI